MKPSGSGCDGLSVQERLQALTAPLALCILPRRMAESARRRGVGRIPLWSAALVAALLFALLLAPRAGAVPAGQLYVSGYNSYGELGDGSTHERDTPCCCRVWAL